MFFHCLSDGDNFSSVSNRRSEDQETRLTSCNHRDYPRIKRSR